MITCFGHFSSKSSGESSLPTGLKATSPERFTWSSRVSQSRPATAHVFNRWTTSSLLPSLKAVVLLHVVVLPHACRMNWFRFGQSTWYDGGFFLNLKETAPHLKDSARVKPGPWPAREVPGLGLVRFLASSCTSATLSVLPWLEEETSLASPTATELTGSGCSRA